MLLAKIVVAASVLVHFLGAMLLFKTQRMTDAWVKFIHHSVFAHMVVIVLLAKAMFYLTW
ncbi:hypothetical protein D3C73_1544240 [compost metagenome]